MRTESSSNNGQHITTVQTTSMLIKAKHLLQAMMLLSVESTAQLHLRCKCAIDYILDWARVDKGENTALAKEQISVIRTL